MIRILCTLLVVVGASVAQASNSIEQPGFFSDIAAPVVTPAWVPFAYGSALTVTFAIFEDQIDDPAQKEVVEDKPLGKWSHFGDLSGQGIPNLLYVMGASASGYFFDDPTSYRRAKHMFLATAYSGIMAQVVKNIVREPRPNNRDDRASFPSGHTTTAFAFASVVGMDHGWAWGVPAYSLALLVAYSRMNDNKHYLHDVVGGATLGLGYGLGLYYNMVRRSETPKVYVDNIYVAPNSEGGQSLILAHYF